MFLLKIFLDSYCVSRKVSQQYLLLMGLQLKMFNLNRKIFMSVQQAVKLDSEPVWSNEIYFKAMHFAQRILSQTDRRIILQMLSNFQGSHTTRFFSINQPAQQMKKKHNIILPWRTYCWLVKNNAKVRKHDIFYPSSFILHPASFILHPSSFILHAPSSILHPPSFPLHTL